MGTSKKAEYKNQHYVPQLYFRFFSNDGKTIQIFDKEKKQHYKDTPIKSQSSEDYFLGKDKELEKNISTIETSFKLVVDKLNKTGFEDITDDEYRSLLTYICFQHKRTRHERDLMNQLSTEMRKKVLKVTNKLTEKEIKLSDEMIDGLKFDDPHLFVFSLAMSLYSGVLLSDLEKCLLINNTNKNFVFSDSPVVLHNSYFSNQQDSGVGYQSPGLQVLYPISNNRAILLYDSKYYKLNSEINLIEIDKESDIDLINLVQMLYCKKLVYFSNHTEINRLQKLRKKYAKLFVPPSIKIATYKPADKRINGELVKHYNTIYNIKLDLSFLTESLNPEPPNHCRDDKIFASFEHFVDNNLIGKFKS